MTDSSMFRSILAALAIAAALASGAGPGAAEAGEKPPDSKEGGGREPEPGKDGGKEKGDGEKGEPQPEKPADPPPDPPELAAALAALDKLNARLTTLVVPYVQNRKVRISKKIRKSEGVMLLEKRPAPAGIRILFEETVPHRMKLLFTDDAVVFRDLETDKVEVFDPKKGGVRPSEMWILGRPMEDLRKCWTFRLGTLEEEEKKSFSALLVLAPKKKDLEKWVKEMHVKLSAKDSMPMNVKIIDPRDEYQEFVFDTAKQKMNGKISAEAFDVEGKTPK